MVSGSGGWIDKSVEWLIFNNHIKCFDYDDFIDFEKIGDGGLSNIRKATWQDCKLTVVLKSVKDKTLNVVIALNFVMPTARSLENAKSCTNILDFALSSLRDFGHAYFYEFDAHSPINYLKISTPHHKKLWEDKYNKVREYLFKQIRNAVAEKELLDCTDKFLVDNITRKVKKDHKKAATITNIKKLASSEKCKVIVSKQKDDDMVKLIDSVCKVLDSPKEEIIVTNKKKIKKAYKQRKSPYKVVLMTLSGSHRCK
ncbi:12162_t:CDS:2 [Cetraspora pellucida]|uniref:12162_t:CDS:1 n=1 Tax=Cetraspora pellucida TaxID=1433469 RepID=A0ACA9KM08_9GLOM|nr:12162_t:CDS:2 [Cetraspora pellucida]